MAVIRQRRQNIASNIGVIRADTGATQSWAKVGELADTFIESSFNDLKRIAKEKGIETAQAASAADLRVIDPITGDIKAFSIPDGFGTVAQQAYKEIVEARYLKQTETEFKNKASEIAIQVQFDPDSVGMFTTEFGKYIDESAKNTSPRFAQAIENLGNSLLASNKMSLMQDKIIRDRDEQAKDIKLGVDEAVKDIAAIASSLNFNDVTQADIDELIQAQSQSIQNGVKSGLYSEKAGNGYIEDLKSAQYTGLAQRIISTIASDPLLKSNDVVQVNKVIRSNGVGLDKLPTKLQPLVNSFLSNDDFPDFQDGLLRDLTGFTQQLSDDETTQQANKTRQEKEADELAVKDFLKVNNGIKEDQATASSNIRNSVSTGNFADAFAEFTRYSKEIDNKIIIATKAGRGSIFLQNSRSEVRQGLLYGMMSYAVNSGSDNEYTEGVALGEYLESNGQRGELNDQQKAIADKIIDLHTGEDRTFIRREMNVLLGSVQPATVTAVQLAEVKIDTGLMTSNTPTEQKASDNILSKTLPSGLKGVPLENAMLAVDFSNPTAETETFINKLDDMLMRNIVPKSVQTVLDTAASGSVVDETVLIKALNIYKRYSNFKGPKGTFVNKLRPAQGKGVDESTQNVLETVLQITNVEGVKDISNVFSKVVANSNDPVKITNGLSRIYQNKFTEVKDPRNKHTKYLNSKFGSNFTAQQMFSPIIETMAANGQSMSQIEARITEVYESHFPETGGVVVDPNSGTSNRSAFALDRVFPDSDYKTAFIVEAQEKISQEMDGNFRISEHFMGNPIDKVVLVPFPDQSLVGGTVRYIAHHVRDGELTALVGDNGPVVIGSDIANDRIKNIEAEREQARLDAGRATDKQIRDRAKASVTGRSEQLSMDIDAP